MNFFAISGLLLGLSTFVFSVFFFLKGNSKTARVWAVFNLSVAVWGFGSFMIATTTSASEALFWWRATYVGVIFIPIFFYHFVHEILQIKQSKLLITSYILGVAFLISNFSGHLISHTRWVFDQFYFDSPPGIIFPYFTAFFFLSVIYSHYLLWKHSRKHAKGFIPEQQLRVFYVVTGISFFGGAMNFLPVYHIDIYPSFNILTVVYGLTISYVLLQAHIVNGSALMQDRFIRIGSLVTAFVVGMMVNFMVSGLNVSIGPMITNMVSVFISLIIYDPIRKYFKRITTNHFTSSLGI